MNLPAADRKKLPSLLEELSRAVEDLLLSGLTTASEATRQTLGVAFQEASRMRLLRLGSTLRIANEELGRFTRDEPGFSRKRLCFFLNRAWLLSRGLARALQEGDEERFDRLLWTPAGQPIQRLEVVTLGAAKKVVAGAFCSFEFRLRTVQSVDKIAEGHRLVWSCVFPLKPGMDVPAEGFLHLPQKQKFKPYVFLEGKTVIIEKASAALDEHGGRLSLGDASTVSAGKDFTDWYQYLDWTPDSALQRIRGHQPSPFDLEVEMQEEIVLRDWQVGEPADREEEGLEVYPITSGTMTFEAGVSKKEEGKALRKSLTEYRKKKKKPPLFGLMHYERCRLMLQPLSVLDVAGPKHLTISDEKVDRAALLKTLKF